MIRIFFLGGLMALMSCGNPQRQDTAHAQKGDTTATNTNTLLADTNVFKDTIDGKAVRLYTIRNASGITASITNYGGRLVSLLVPDSAGKLTDVIVGPGSLKDYEASTEPYFGASIGRVGNRIAKGTFTLDGKTYHIFTNNGINTLHGGKKGFQYVVWDAAQPNDSTLQLSYNSPDGEENFPGNLAVKITFTLKGDRSLNLEYEAKTDKRTPVNLTNHGFFNLNGAGSGTIDRHILQIDADRYTPIDSSLIPFGRLDKVAGTPFDFRTPTTIGSRINEKNEQLAFGKGYDHNYVLNKPAPGAYSHAAKVVGDKSGIVMDIYTTEPGLQFYSGNFMLGANLLKHGLKDDHRTAIALETQHFPDAVNQPAFPSIILEPGKVYQTHSAYVFSVKK
ncbi:aldose 1-epimerase [bacterium A37T11]|nr:aldose 1-epimerase [bacterium A37T11]